MSVASRVYHSIGRRAIITDRELARYNAQQAAITSWRKWQLTGSERDAVALVAAVVAYVGPRCDGDLDTLRRRTLIPRRHLDRLARGQLPLFRDRTFELPED